MFREQRHVSRGIKGLGKLQLIHRSVKEITQFAEETGISSWVRRANENPVEQEVKGGDMGVGPWHFTQATGMDTWRHGWQYDSGRINGRR